MSSGADCRFVEKKPGEWWYKLQEYPYGAIEEYDSFGPFTSYDKAVDHLDENHQNPGGWSIDRHPDGNGEPK